MLALISPFMICNSAPNKIVMLALRVCMQSVFSFRRLQLMYVGILAVQITFKLGFFLLAFKCFKLGNLFDIPFCLKYVVVLHPE
jgi:hypothetical protein